MEKINNHVRRNWAVVGAGGFGREVCCVVKNNIDYLNLNEFIGFFDDNNDLNRENELGKIVGSVSDLCEKYNNITIFLAIANPKSRFAVYQRLRPCKFDFPNLLNFDFKILHKESFKIGRGNIVFSRSSVSVNVTLGDFNILNSNISIGHDSEVGNFNTFMPATKISGDVIIGDQNNFGLNCGVLQGVNVGNCNTVGPMSVLYKNTKNNQTYLGNPAKIFEF